MQLGQDAEAWLGQSPLEQEYNMVTAIDRFLFGLCFGVGFAVAYNVVTFIGQFFHAPGYH